MVFLGLVHPDHIVEQQVLAVARGQALVRKSRAADHDGAELANFRVDAEFTHACSPE